MNISGLVQILSSTLDAIHNFLAPIPGLLLLCTCTRRPGFSAILTSAKIYADMYQNENDDIVKEFVFNVIERIKINLQDDGVCFVAIPPGELKFQLFGANGGGPMILSESPTSTPENPEAVTNNSYIFTWGIIR